LKIFPVISKNYENECFFTAFHFFNFRIGIMLFCTATYNQSKLAFETCFVNIFLLRYNLAPSQSALSAIPNGREES